MTDVVIIGAGMQGATLALALHERGLRPTVVEQGAICAGATASSYGIVHGGLRYLQSLDIGRWRRSREAQAWFLGRYGSLVRPLECVMPLYRGCVRSRTAFRIAGALDDVLAAALGPKVPLPRVRLIGREDVLKRFAVPADGLTGAAVWYDASVDDAAALVAAILDDAGVAGDRLLTATRAERLIVRDGRAVGVTVRGSESHARDVEAPIVVDCRGAGVTPFGTDLAQTPAVLAFNLVLDLPWAERAALAVSERPGRGRSYFVRGGVDGDAFVGTFYRAAGMETTVNADDIADALAVLDRALPGSGFATAGVRQVLAGLLPAGQGAPDAPAAADRVTIGGPPGYATVLGAKLTTAPILSRQVAARIAEAVR